MTDPAPKRPDAGDPASKAERPSLIVDSDWKAQAQAEKERLAQKEQARERERPKGGVVDPDGLPPADFRTIVNMLASQALMALGAYGDPKTGRVIVDPPGAKLAIDLLGVLEEKTKGNLAEDEASELREVLAALRSRFVYFLDLIAREGAAGRTEGSGPPPTPPAGTIAMP